MIISSQYNKYVKNIDGGHPPNKKKDFGWCPPSKRIKKETNHTKDCLMVAPPNNKIINK